MVGILVRGYTCAMSYCDLSLTFDLDSVKMFSTVIFETYFLYDNDIWIAATDYYLCQGGIILITDCLSLCPFVCWQDYAMLLRKQKMCQTYIPLNF